MKERGIIFNDEMVRAILDGRKTQTRRIIKSVPTTHDFHGWVMSSTCAKDEGKACWAIGDSPLLKDPIRRNCPFGKIGDRLWVRETWQCGLCTESTFAYRATHKPSDLEEGWSEIIKWRPSSQMPRWASRILLEITGVRVERLQDISQADAIAEGAPPSHPTIDVVSREYGFPDFSRSWFWQTWWHIYGKKNWQANPWVWVIEFKQIQG
ncbi:hypothetical protein ISO55_09960 [Morganella morganii subsp. morganii]|uniref:hypothetical protein n=1 Tax=Morganella morganii TaxID=582 RepID=UPI001BDA30D3|nr:hypothetical protein [Morganella morganii]MBT0367283.1 hypothetical protein [Morganella morganii subsp. morganii]